jgi:hypothetical protein
VSRDSTNGALSVFGITVTQGPPLHAHDHEHESVYVLEGELSVICGDDRFSRRPAASSSCRVAAHTPLLVHQWIHEGAVDRDARWHRGLFRELHAAQETEPGAVEAKYGIHPVGESRRRRLSTRCDASAGSRAGR